MSYILEALKKAERERRVGQVPGLDGVTTMATATASPRRWVFVLGSILLVNLLVLGYLAFRGTDSWQSDPDVAQDMAQVAEAGNTVPTRAEPRMPEKSSPPSSARMDIETKPAIVESSEASPPASANLEPARESAPKPKAAPAEPKAATIPKPKPAATARPSTGFRVAKPGTLPPVLAELPTSVRSGLPELALTVHVYSSEPAKRFVFINDRRYREGETLREGPKLQSIEKHGAVLSYRGRQFLVPGRW